MKMVKKHHKREERLSRIVMKALEKKPYNYVCSNPDYLSAKGRGAFKFLNLGIGGTRADVIGIKETGYYSQSKIEVIAVEVKNWQQNYTLGNMDQARRASELAHKCYLAAPRKFKPEEIEAAVEKGIGLFEIIKAKKKIKEVLPSSLQNPAENKVRYLLGKLGYYKCALCGCYLSGGFTGRGFRSYVWLTKNRGVRKWLFLCSICKKKIQEISKNYADEWGDYLMNEISSLKKELKKYANSWGNYLERKIKKSH